MHEKPPSPPVSPIPQEEADQSYEEENPFVNFFLMNPGSDQSCEQENPDETLPVQIHIYSQAYYSFSAQAGLDLKMVLASFRTQDLQNEIRKIALCVAKDPLSGETVEWVSGLPEFIEKLRAFRSNPAIQLPLFPQAETYAIPLPYLPFLEPTLITFAKQGKIQRIIDKGLGPLEMIFSKLTDGETIQFAQAIEQAQQAFEILRQGEDPSHLFPAATRYQR